MGLPNFLIVGAMKSGTTTLSDYLVQHPQVFMPKKELHFFSRSDRFSQGIDWYEHQFRRASTERAIGEKTPTYSYQPEAVERIAQVLPQVKLIWILREPVARAYSNYWHAVKSGVESLSFAAAIQREDQRIQQNIFKGYLKRSIYVEQVDRFLQYFPQEQMLFLRFEALIQEPQATLARTFEFLEVDPTQAIALQPRSSNTTTLPRSIYLEWLARTLFGSGRIYQLVHRLNRRKVRGYPPLNAELHRKLQDYFQPFNTQLAQRTGLDVTEWHT